MTEHPRDTRIIKLGGKCGRRVRFALISACDYARVLAAGPWYAKEARNTTYARGGPKGRQQHLHTFIAGFPLTDHANGCGLDNRRGNLRPVTPKENARNAPGRANSTSRFKGVSRSGGRRNPWQAHIRIEGKTNYLGSFSTEEEAARVYDEAALEAFGEFAWTNFAQKIEPRRARGAAG